VHPYLHRHDDSKAGNSKHMNEHNDRLEHVALQPTTTVYPHLAVQARHPRPGCFVKSKSETVKSERIAEYCHHLVNVDFGLISNGTIPVS